MAGDIVAIQGGLMVAKLNSQADIKKCLTCFHHL
jgi:hypothetical protein